MLRLRRYAALEAMAVHFPRPHLAIGTFDGIHRGHQAVLRALQRSAAAEGHAAAVLTFVPHPLAVLRPDGAPPALGTRDQRARLLESLHIDALVELPFDADLAAVGAAEFVQEYLCRRAGARKAFVGQDFTFGAGGSGTPEALAVLGRQSCGLETTTVPLVVHGGAPVSSTRIREALQAGRPGQAARLLGRPYAVEGRIVRGEGRGRTLGFPTANVEVVPGIALPAPGVYAVRCRRAPDGGARDARAQWNGVANLGRAPTFGGGAQRLEVHLFDFAGDLYGLGLEVEIVRRLRGERRFASAEALRRRIAVDAERARAVLRAAASVAAQAAAPSRA